MTDPYDELGVPRDASKDEIRRAFKRRAHATHPDKGGDGESFKRVNAAATLLLDDARRERYDAGGGDGNQDEHAMMANAVFGILLQGIDRGAPDPVDFVIQHFRREIANLQATHGQLQKDIAKNERALKRMRKAKSATRSDTMLMDMLKHHIEAQKRGAAQIPVTIEKINGAIAFVGSYAFEPDEEDRPEPFDMPAHHARYIEQAFGKR